MARLSINISDKLNEEMREYIEDNNMTITIFLHLAITKYIESQKQSKELQAKLTEMFMEKLEKEKKKE